MNIACDGVIIPLSRNEALRSKTRAAKLCFAPPVFLHRGDPEIESK